MSRKDITILLGRYTQRDYCQTVANTQYRIHIRFKGYPFDCDDLLLRMSICPTITSEIALRTRARFETFDMTCITFNSNGSESTVITESALISFSQREKKIGCTSKEKSPGLALKYVPNQIHARYTRAKHTSEPALG